MHVNASSHTLAHTCMNTLTLEHTHAHPHPLQTTHTHAHTHTHACEHTLPLPHTRIHPPEYPGTHLSTRNHTLKRAHTHAHTHTSRPTCGHKRVVGQQCLRGLTYLDATVWACGLHAAGRIPACACAPASKKQSGTKGTSQHELKAYAGRSDPGPCLLQYHKS